MSDIVVPYFRVGLVFFNQEEDATYSVKHVMGAGGFKMTDLFHNLTVKGLSEEEFTAPYGEVGANGFKKSEPVG